jgi:hypothetical protein
MAPLHAHAVYSEQSLLAVAGVSLAAARRSAIVLTTGLISISEGSATALLAAAAWARVVRAVVPVKITTAITTSKTKNVLHLFIDSLFIDSLLVCVFESG